MEAKRSDKLKDLNTLLEMLKLNERKVEKAQNTILEILPKVFEARTIISACQKVVDNHLSFLRRNNIHFSSGRFKQFERDIRAWRRLIETYFPLFKELRAYQADLISVINTCEQTQVKILNAKTSAELSTISIGAPFPIFLCPHPEASQLKHDGNQLAVLVKVQECLVELRSVVDEEKAELTRTLFIYLHDVITLT